ncbi:hypothetical protein Tco_0544254 [Tanacetum coccineum]
MVAYLKRPTDSDDFTGIVDFLNPNLIRYALTVNPTIYVSCIEQFWSTAKAQTINEETQIHALVDGKKIVITESSVRRDLQFANEDGTDYLPTITIFENLKLMVQDLETTKTAQAKEITSLKKRVKNLEQRGRSRTPGLKRLYKVGTSRRVESSAKASLGDQEDASK